MTMLTSMVYEESEKIERLNPLDQIRFGDRTYAIQRLRINPPAVNTRNYHKL